MNNYPKRLIEVDLPIKRISAHARREKSIRHGHISTLHIWWARRPLAACRAVILASLWPDPADPACPVEFLNAARHAMQEWTTHERQILLSPESRRRFDGARKNSSLFDDPVELRGALLDFIADFANWDNSTESTFLSTSRVLTKVAHEALGGAPESHPVVVDPFAGGGAIPLEASRVGADAFASDLNPIPVLLNRMVLEFVPKFGGTLSESVKTWGDWVKAQSERELSSMYPINGDGSSPITYIWARTTTCEGPGCGAEVPLVRSFLLSKRGNTSIGLGLDKCHSTRSIKYKLEKAPTPEPFSHGTLKRGSATCPICGYTMQGERVRKQTADRKGGANDALLLAVYCQAADGSRFYREPEQQDLEAISIAKKFVEDHQSLYLSSGVPEIPDEELPYLRSIFNINLIGVERWSQMFSARQLACLLVLAKNVRRCFIELSKEDPEYAKAIVTALAFAVDRQADYLSSICTWVQSGEFVGHTFAQGQSLPIKWDFAEVAPFAGGSGNWDGAVGWICRVLDEVAESKLLPGHVEQASATNQPLPDDCAQLVFTDPPYYDAIPYADLSDFFYVWLKRTVGPIYPTLFQSEVTQKEGEIVQLAERNTKYAYKTREYFENLMQEALSDSRRVASPSGLAVVVFAHKETTAWETMLQAVISAGWIVVASWPIDTEMGARLRARNSAALASSVHLVCRPRENQDGSLRNGEIGDWRDVLAELPRRIHEWMPRLAEEGVVGADAIFACLGPALEIFSRYSSVEKASGEVVRLGEYLEHVWAAVAKEALVQVFKDADTAGFEPDARLTAMWLWTLNAGATGGEESESDDDQADGDDEEEGKSKGKTKGGFVLEFDAARKIAQGLGASLEDLSALVEVSGDSARLLPVSERTRHLFGKDQEDAPTTGRKKKAAPQMDLFAELTKVGADETAWQEKTVQKVGETTLDRIHQSMILFATGRGEALKRFLVDDGAGKDQRFWRLAQALSALYPASTNEKRWVDGVLARKKGLGL